MHSKQYIADGPADSDTIGSAAFYTDTDEFTYGGRMSGTNTGVFGEAVEGGMAGVFGKGTRVVCGILGAGEKTSIGVVGVCLATDAEGALARGPRARPLREQVRGSGAGVLGMSGTGPGVVGETNRGTGGKFSSTGGSGVQAASGTGVAVHGSSRYGRGAVFESGPKVAQLQLIPHVQSTVQPRLPKRAQIGDVLLIQSRPRSRRSAENAGRCSLWLCVPGTEVSAQWCEIQLGAPISGTE